MSLLDYFRKGKPNTAALAKERLQIIVAHQRGGKHADYLPLLQEELIRVISKYVAIDTDQVKVSLDQAENCSVLELNITLPERASISN
jgi:cell division topological specificity factor